MIIANPIYDVVFKYLLEDIEIARELLSTILGEEVLSLDVKPQETTTENTAASISILRFDFKAVLKTKTGELKKALIELQKAKLLTHDSYLIQLKLLAGKSRTKLEKVLQVFSPEFKTEDNHQLNFKGDLDEPLVQKIVARLERAIASEEIREKMDVEDEIDRIFERELSKLAKEKDKIIAIKDQELEAKDQELEAKGQELEAERQKAEAERQKAEVERQKAEDLQKELEELRKLMKK